jgi:hypoxanthine phosphoribosyltransferase
MKLGRTLIDAAALEEGISRIASEVDRDQNGRPVLLVGILKGSVFFLCDLAKRMKTPVSLDFLQVSSYGSGTKSSGNVRLVRDLSSDVAGREVIIVEDIVDTGRTLHKIVEILGTRHPKSVKICALEKRIPGNEGIPVDYLGFYHRRPFRRRLRPRLRGVLQEPAVHRDPGAGGKESAVGSRQSTVKDAK